jgi:hypothetical protein
VAWVLFLGFIVLILLGVPITMAIGAAVLAALLIAGFTESLYILALLVLEGVDNPALLAIPFFFLAG